MVNNGEGRLFSQKNVALIIESSNDYARKTLHGICKFLRENKHWSIFFYEHERGNTNLARFEHWKGDGIIARIENKTIANSVKRKNLPTVDLSSFRFLPEIPYVETDDLEYAHCAANHLLARGFKNFAYCGDSKYNWSKLREKYFVQYINKQGYSCDVFDTDRYRDSEVNVHNKMMQWVQSLPKPVGIMACFDNQGHTLLEACRMAKVKVPYSVAVIGCDNDELVCELSEPSLSSIIPNAVMIGYKAALLLEKQMNGEVLDSLEYLFGPVGIQTRQSTDVMATDDKVVMKALDFIQKNACFGINVNDVLKQVHLSRRVFESRFRKSVNKSPHEEILDVKIKYARQLLEKTEFSIEEIAEKTGFFHPEYFSVAFKRKTLLTPREYRKLNKSSTERTQHTTTVE